jgi:hypothetical protein
LRHIRLDRKVTGALKTSPYEGETPFSLVLFMDKDISGEKLILTLTLTLTQKLLGMRINCLFS